MKKMLIVLSLIVIILGSIFINSTETTTINSNISINEISDVYTFANKVVINNIEASASNSIISNISAASIENKELNKSYKLIKKSNIINTKYIIIE